MNKIFNSIIFAFLNICIFASLTACTSDDTVSSNDASLRFSISDQGATAVATSRATLDDETMTTKFEAGDKAGVFAICNGKVVDGINNVKLTCESSGFWTPATQILAADVPAGTKFYCYFPYDANATVDAAANDPLAAYSAAFEIGSDQSTRELFNAADLMTSAATQLNNMNNIDIALIHRNALVNVALPNVSYIFNNTDKEIPAYVVAKAEKETFALGGKAISPYFDEATQTYCYIVPANTTETLNVNFDNQGTKSTATISDLANISASQYAKYVIDGGTKLTKMTLQVGDFYLSDGNIVSKDDELTDAQKAKVIGVVYQLGTTGRENTDNYPQHAMIVSIKQDAKQPWGGFGSTSSADNAAGWRYWYDSYNINDIKDGETRVTAAANVKWNILSANGCDYTDAWCALDSVLTIGGITKYVTCKTETTPGFKAAVRNFRANNPKPAITSDWFIPSLLEWKNINIATDVVNASIEKAGGSKLGDLSTGAWPSSTQYWSSNIRSAAIMWSYIGAATITDATLPSSVIKTPKLTDSNLYRFILAF